MTNSGFIQLGDFFPDKQLTCGVRGCNNLCMADGDLPESIEKRTDVPEHLCERCAKRLAELEPRDEPCTQPGCSNTWTCPPLTQLEHELQNRSPNQPIKGICEDCRDKLERLQNIQVPCQMQGCENTWTWTPKEQLEAYGEPPPERYCGACEHDLENIRDRRVQCRLQGCEGTWTWTVKEQILHKRSGNPLSTPPRKACDSCRKLLESLSDQEIPCRVKGCSRTWTFSVEAQLQHHLMHGEGCEPPKRMCKPCYDFHQKSEDRLVRCQTRGCNGRCLYSQRHQLEDFAAGEATPPKLLCKRCRGHLQTFTDQAVECSVPGCTNQWTYTAKDQMLDAAGKRHARHPEKRCQECEKFLSDHTTETLKCEDCGCDVSWSPYEQLLHWKGGFAKPVRCPDCNRKNLPGNTKPDDIVHHPETFSVHVPPKGPWLRDKALADWPVGMTHDALLHMQAAEHRVVVAVNDKPRSDADDAETRIQAWPNRMEELAEGSLEGKVALVDVGIPGTTSVQLVTRFPRDVEPFKPQVVVFNFTLADCRIPQKDHMLSESLQPALSQKDSEQAVAKLCSLCGKLGAKPVLIIPNPVFPEWAGENEERREHSSAAWEKRQDAEFRQRVAATSHAFREHGGLVLDFRPRFEVNGQRSARKWMADWQSPNATGHTHIAIWTAAELKKLLEENN